MTTETNPWGVILSSGTRLVEYQRGDGATEAVVYPDAREMTESEWEEYCLFLRSLSNDQKLARERHVMSADDYAREFPELAVKALPSA